MPQMAPLWWETLYILFTMLFLMTMIILYHFKMPMKMMKSTQIYNTTQLNWKW
uniref:ATP synthase F0 subunit 8 n=1 Tax=Tessaratoma papillosa TaxID=236711 RepID=A0A343W8Z4_9HEMI|nr:ATP synthase F0 subunit 8 [Tessaratoma papillosa]AVZ00834.1 ATP synthase F0 subunit 8 [Tessaratoma papillosa]